MAKENNEIEKKRIGKGKENRDENSTSNKC